MQHTEIKQIVFKTLIEIGGCDESELTDDANLVEDLGLDSLDSVEFIMELEKQFNMVIPDEVAETVETVGDASKAVEGLLKEKGN